MSLSIKHLALFAISIAIGIGLCQAAADAEDAAALPVFPGAVGFGATTKAGRGGQIVKVTNLNADGEGSLRAAVNVKGPRVIVFEVGGVIDLGPKELSIDEPFVTIAGQSSPAPGITLIGERVKVGTHDVLIQHLRVRAGDKYKGEPDCLSVGSYDGAKVFNVVVDHCTFTWSVDECASVSGKGYLPHDVTFSNCIIAHSLSKSTHKKGEHSKGSLIHNGCTRVALLGNLFAHHFRRSPYIKADASTVVANNLIYNPGQLAIHVSHFSGTPAKVSVMGNVFRAGANTPVGLGLISTLGGGIKIHTHDNLAFDVQGKPGALTTKGGSGEVKKWNARFKALTKPEIAVEGFEPLPAAEVEAVVLARAGAWPGKRDALDKGLVEEVKARGGKIINSPADVGGYPRVEPTKHTLDWATLDPAKDSDGDGYTDVEEKLHGLAAQAEGRAE